jgi:Zn-finger nucleic acid-binding protein
MEDQKDRFGEKMRLVERAKEDIYFAEKDRELIEKLKARLKKIERKDGSALRCPKCQGVLETYLFMDFVLDRCAECQGIWLDNGELQGILKKVARSPLSLFVERLISKGEEIR